MISALHAFCVIRKKGREQKNHSRNIEHLAFLSVQSITDQKTSLLERNPAMKSKQKSLAILFISNSHTYYHDLPLMVQDRQSTPASTAG